MLFYLSQAPRAEWSYVPCFEVDASTITGVFTIDHRTQKQKGNGMISQLTSVGHIGDDTVLHVDKAINHCYTFTIPEELQHADEFDAWAADLKRHENAVVEYYQAGWEESLAAERLTEVPFHASSASCLNCQGTGQKLRLPKFRKLSTPLRVTKIFDPMVRVSSS